MEKRGLARIKLDLLFILAGSIKVEKNFNYEQQRDYYLKKLFAEPGDWNDIIEFGKKCKRVSELMFPNEPTKVRKKFFLGEVLADSVLLKEMSQAENFVAVNNEPKIKSRCFESFKIIDANVEATFRQEISRRYSQYIFDLTEADFEEFKGLMKIFASPFTKILEAVQSYLTMPIEKKSSAFSLLCKKLNVPDDKKMLFKLKLDALAEIQIVNNAHLDYFDDFQNAWQEKFPEYKYCEEIETYIRQEKSACIVAFGNKLHSLRNEILLFDLLADVNIKLVLSDGALNLEEVSTALEKNFEQVPQDNIKKTLDERLKKSLEYYSLNTPKNYSTEIKEEFVPYRAALLYVNEILMEELFRRYKMVAEQIRTPSDRDTEKKYEVLLSQKDAEIYMLKRDLEYYENVKSQAFRSDFSGYDDALTKLFTRLCDYKFGAPLNELYILSKLETDIPASTINTIVRNFLFVFGGMNIIPYETKNLGKKITFDSEEANVVFAVNEKNVVDGINSGTLKYPGWKHGDKKIVLPMILMDKEEN